LGLSRWNLIDLLVINEDIYLLNNPLGNGTHAEIYRLHFVNETFDFVYEKFLLAKEKAYGFSGSKNLGILQLTVVHANSIREYEFSE
jgi:hypothetical protein